MAKLPRIFICIDLGRVWEVAGDIPVTLVVKNVEKGWLRHITVPQDPAMVDQEEELIKMIELEGIKGDGQLEEDRALQARIDKRKQKST